MDVQMVNPFIDSTIHVLETMASTTAQAGKPYLKKDCVATGDVSGVIGLTGESSGTLSISFSESCILPIVSNMFGEEMTELNDEIKDAVGEITNMISGQTRQRWEDLGILIKAAIPTVITGHNHTIKHISSAPIIAIPFSTTNGTFTIEACLE